MSSEAHKGSGDAAFQRYFSRNLQRPFLERNVRKALRSLTMGMAMSSLTRTTAKPLGNEEGGSTRLSDDAGVEENEEEDEDCRPAKRRKTNGFDLVVPDMSVPAARYPSESPRRKPFGHVMNESRKRFSRGDKLQAVQPSSFYGKPSPNSNEAHSKSTSTSTKSEAGEIQEPGIKSLLPQDPENFQKALRIDVSGIRLKSPDDPESLNFMKRRTEGPIDIKCRCQVRIWSKNKGDDASEDVYKLSKSCILRTRLMDESYLVREIVYLEPFILTAEQIYVNRSRMTASGSVERTLEFADKYCIEIQLDAAGLQRDWPPFDLPSVPGLDVEGRYVGLTIDPGPVTDIVNKNQSRKRDLYLSARLKGFMRPETQCGPIDLSLCLGKVKQVMKNEVEGIAYVLNVSTRWSLPKRLKGAIKPAFPKPEPSSITISNCKQDIVPQTPSPAKCTGPVRVFDIEAVANSPEGRVQRSRASKHLTYNLKTLSAQAQGKSPRKSWTAKPKDPSEASATYEFGKPDAVGYGVRAKSTISGLRCPFCGREHPCLNELRLHLHTNHINFSFTLLNVDTRRPRFLVELAKRSHLPPKVELQQTLQLGASRTLLDLEKFLNGDETWLKARQGPLHEQVPDRFVGIANESSGSSSPYMSRQSSPNTSSYTDHENIQPARPCKKYIVPKTTKPLYDTISKRTLQPGEEVPSSEDEKNEGWLHQKHRDIILDFDDVTADEKDYILRWNPFVMNAHLTTETYIPTTILAFVNDNMTWFVERPSRREMLSKHCETFLLRGILTQECFTEVMELLRHEQIKAGRDVGIDTKMGGEEDKNQPSAPARLRGLYDCACGRLTQPPDRIVCRGDVGHNCHTLDSITNMRAGLCGSVFPPQMCGRFGKIASRVGLRQLHFVRVPSASEWHGKELGGCSGPYGLYFCVHYMCWFVKDRMKGSSIYMELHGPGDPWIMRLAEGRSSIAVVWVVTEAASKKCKAHQEAIHLLQGQGQDKYKYGYKYQASTWNITCRYLIHHCQPYLPALLALLLT